jgi:methylenetetrahydrofolate dehydrogenase (NADP+)/methenyltetrahydrofolate cyclohydrolase
VTAAILDGKAMAASIRNEIATQLLEHRAGGVPQPHLVAVLVGDDPASQVYVRNKHRACEQAGLKTTVVRLPAETPQATLLSTIERLNGDRDVHGILVQLPLPRALDTRAVLDTIDPRKDVDGFHAINAGLLSQGRPRFVPCTPLGILELLHRSGITVRGRRAVVVGRSDIVGKPLALLLSARESPVSPEVCNATVTLAHSQTPELAGVVREAEIVIAAVGQPELIRGSMLRHGAVAIDVGINRQGDRLVGDIAFDEAREVASAITPVPGGVGPLTIAMLLRNTVDAAIAFHTIGRSTI